MSTSSRPPAKVKFVKSEKKTPRITEEIIDKLVILFESSKKHTFEITLSHNGMNFMHVVCVESGNNCIMSLSNPGYPVEKNVVSSRWKLGKKLALIDLFEELEKSFVCKLCETYPHSAHIDENVCLPCSFRKTDLTQPPDFECCVCKETKDPITSVKDYCSNKHPDGLCKKCFSKITDEKCPMCRKLFDGNQTASDDDNDD